MTRARAGAVVLALALLIPFAGYVTDDTFIHFQFVKHLLRGEGFAFNAGVPTYGATSPLWVLLLAFTGLFVPGASATPAASGDATPLLWIAKAWGAIFTALSVVWVGRIARRLGWSGREGTALTLLVALHAWSLRWAISGMETPLALFAAIAAADAMAAALLEGGPSWRAGVWLAVAALARPECLLLALLAAGAIAYGRPAGGVAGASPASRVRAALSLAAGFGIPYGAWLVAAWLQFHRLLPNTSGAKAGAWFDLERGIAAVRDVIRIGLAAEAVPLALAVVAFAFGAGERLRRMEPGRRAFWLWIALWPAALAASFALAGVQVVSRYLVPAAPSILLLGLASFRVLVATRLPRARATAFALALFVGAHAAEGIGMTLAVSAPSARAHAAGLRASLAEIGVWARARTAPGTLFAVADIGAFGYWSDRPVLDLYGLVTPAMGPVVVREGYDRVVSELRFEAAGRPAYLVDRARMEARLTSTPDPLDPYRFLFARSISNLGITRPGSWTYSVYAIDWAVYDRHHPRFAAR